MHYIQKEEKKACINFVLISMIMVATDQAEKNFLTFLNQTIKFNLL